MAAAAASEAIRFEMDSQVVENVLSVGKDIDQVRDRRTLVAAHIPDAAFQ